MTATAGFKRLGFALVAALLVGAGLIVTENAMISRDAVRQEAINEIRAVTGLNPMLRGKTTVSLFPSGIVSFADVVLGDAKHPALTAERLTVRLRFFPLLIGRVEIADVALEKPTIAVDMEPSGQSNWSGLVQALARSQKASTQRIAAFSEIRINQGTVVVHERSRKISETVERRGIVAGLAVNFQELRRHRALRLACRAGGRQHHAGRFPGSARRQPFRNQAAPCLRADESRLRRCHQRHADAQA